jgi:hypothetical protein
MAIRFALLALAAAHRTVQVDEHCAYKDSPARGANASPLKPRLPHDQESRGRFSKHALGPRNPCARVCLSPPARNVEQRAGHIGRRVADQPDGRLGDLFSRARAPHRGRGA